VSLLAVLGYTGWWWVMWPERTARNFVTFIAENRSEDRNRILSNELTDGFFDWQWERLTPWSEEQIEDFCHTYPEHAAQVITEQRECLREFRATWVQGTLSLRSRNSLDCLIATQTFTLPGYWFTVERGVVTAFGFVREDKDVDCLAVSW
jgi:hypothetical protein